MARDYRKQLNEALAIANDTKVFEFGNNVLGLAPELFKQNFGDAPALVVADKNTWKVAGQKVAEDFANAEIDCRTYLFEEDEFHAEFEFVKKIDAILDTCNAIPVAVGSGVINDLCKLSAFNHGRPYMVVATAASVDGYASSGAVVTKDGAKINIETHAPKVILADNDVLASAPKEMTAAGYGDLAAKVTSGAEWMIADLFGTEPIIPMAWSLVNDSLNDILAENERIAAGDPEAIGDLFVGLTLTGLAMQIAHTSRPASCSEHLFSHYLDMTEYRYNSKLQSHGFQCAMGTVIMSACFDEFLKMDLSNLDVDACVAAWPTLEQEQKRALDIFKDFPVPQLGYTEITKKYSDAETVRKQLTAVKDNWPDLKARIQNQVYTYDKMVALMRSVGAPTGPECLGLSRKKIREMVDFVQLMRWRINLFDLCKRARLYDTLLDNVFVDGVLKVEA